MDPFNFYTCLFALCYKHNGSVSSWGRTKKHNKEVGGADDSLHRLWVGSDVVLDEMRRNEEFERDADYFGLRAILEGDHYHVEPK